MSLGDLGNPAGATRRGGFALAVLLALAGLVWAEAPDVAPNVAPNVAPESSGGGRSAEAAPAEGVEDADEGDAAPAADPEEEAPDPEPKNDGPADVFVPSENLSEDISVPFPVDI